MEALLSKPMKQRMAITLDETVKDELTATIPKQKRAQFVEMAIAKALREEAKKRALQAIDDLPSFSTDGKDSVEVLRQIRSDRQKYLIDRND